MWPPTSVLLDALSLAVIGGAVILSAMVGRVLGATARGRRALRLAPAALVVLVCAYVGSAWLLSLPAAQASCPYAEDHPSHETC